MSALTAGVRARPGSHDGWQTGWRYRVQPGIRLAADQDGGGLLLARRPLMAMRLNAQAFALIEALGADGAAPEAAARAAGMALREANRFLDLLLQRRLLSREPPPPVRWPDVSIIVAARNRHRATAACVRGLLALDYPAAQREIIVVDDASEPPLRAALDGLPIRLLRLEQNVGQSAARNHAAAAADGDILAFTDNDCLADPGWLRALVPHFHDPEIVIVGGRVAAAADAGPVAAFEAIRSPLDMGRTPGAVGPAEAIAYLPTCNMLVRRDALLAQGGFSQAMRVGEDVDFCWRALRAGGRAAYVPSGRIIHRHRVRLGALLRRRADYGESEADLHQRHPRHQRAMPMPRLSLLALAAGVAGTWWWPTGVTLAAVLLGALICEVLAKHRKLRRIGAPLSHRAVGSAILREHFAALHGLSANALRYYGIPLALAGLAWPPMLPSVLVLLLLAAVTDHRRLKPAIPLPLFAGLCLLEMAAYQAGVWRGCWRRRTLRPLLPTAVWRR